MDNVYRIWLEFAIAIGRYFWYIVPAGFLILLFFVFRRLSRTYAGVAGVCVLISVIAGVLYGLNSEPASTRCVNLVPRNNYKYTLKTENLNGITELTPIPMAPNR
ncbi:MAG TPA: hypothetical protein V6C86_21050 [Oculatellaceae cyanobacterium]